MIAFRVAYQNAAQAAVGLQINITTNNIISAALEQFKMV